MKIQSNTAALAAQRNLGASDGVLGKSIGKLSSGYRLNKASDDAAGMGIANKIRADLKALAQASRNASQATALVQVAEGAVGTISNILDRMKELATQSASDSVTDSDRTKINAEYTQLKDEIDRITSNTKYQQQTLLTGAYGVSVATGTAITAVSGTGINLTSQIGLSNVAAGTTYTIADTSSNTISLSATVNGSLVTQQLTQTASAGAQTLNFDKLGVTLSLNSDYKVDGLSGMTIVMSAAAGGSFQVGTDNAADSKISLTLGNLTTTAAGLNLTGGNLSTLSAAQTASAAIDTAIGKLNDVIGVIGAASNRFDYALQNLQSIMENMGAAESVIRDADVGQEMTTFTKAQILQQAGTAMLAQANAAPQSVLSLLKG